MTATLENGERILVKDQTDKKQNGIYTVTNKGNDSTNWVLTRATDYDTPDKISGSSAVFIHAGTVNINKGFVSSISTITIGTNNIEFEEFTGGGTTTIINDNANNRVITGSDESNTLQAESNLTYDGTTLNIADGALTSTKTKVGGTWTYDKSGGTFTAVSIGNHWTYNNSSRTWTVNDGSGNDNHMDLFLEIE